MELYLTSLHRLADLGARHAADFRSDGFTGFFSTLAGELTSDYFAEMEDPLAGLEFKRGTLMSARPGEGCKGTGSVLRTAPVQVHERPAEELGSGALPFA
jgi:hypothetical protein